MNEFDELFDALGLTQAETTKPAVNMKHGLISMIRDERENDKHNARMYSRLYCKSFVRMVRERINYGGHDDWWRAY